MSTSRLLTLITVMALVVAVVALTLGVSAKTGNASPDLDSATRSYMGWAKAVEARNNTSATIPAAGGNYRIDSAARSYMGWAKAVACGADPAYAGTLDSGTRSYIGWARSVQCGSAR